MRRREIPMDDVEGYAPVYGGTIPALAWHDFMAAALANVPVEQFATPVIAQTQPSYTYTPAPTTTSSPPTTPTTTSR